MNIKEMSVTDRPYEKCMKYGAGALSDAELLAVVLRTGYQERSAIELAHQILTVQDGGILNLYELGLQELMQVRGIGSVKAIELKCIAELSMRLANSRYRRSLCLDKPESIAAYYMERLRHERREVLLIGMFDAKSHLLADEVLFTGSVNTSVSSPREIFLCALRHSAVFIVLLHNHPSGDPTPSEADISMTARLWELGEMLEIRVVDHIIIGDGSFYSFHLNGQL